MTTKKRKLIVDSKDSSLEKSKQILLKVSRDNIASKIMPLVDY